MKTLGRILVILAVMSLVMGITYAAVNAGGASSAAPQFQEDRRPPFREGQFEGRERPERGEGGGGWMFGLIKNVGVIVVLVTLIVFPKSVRRKRRRIAAAG
ncbi:MAG: hypothetical protein OHK0041_03720 [Anaerolineales bacterium]